jgi:hypothetical protein
MGLYPTTLDARCLTSKRLSDLPWQDRRLHKAQSLGGTIRLSSEYDPTTNKAAALAYKTTALCSGGLFLANSTLVNVGGNAPLT